MRSAIDTGWKQHGIQCEAWLVGTYRDNQLSRTEHAHALLSCVWRHRHPCSHTNLTQPKLTQPLSTIDNVHSQEPMLRWNLNVQLLDLSICDIRSHMTVPITWKANLVMAYSLKHLHLTLPYPIEVFWMKLLSLPHQSSCYNLAPNLQNICGTKKS